MRRMGAVQVLKCSAAAVRGFISFISTSGPSRVHEPVRSRRGQQLERLNSCSQPSSPASVGSSVTFCSQECLVTFSAPGPSASLCLVALMTWPVHVRECVLNDTEVKYCIMIVTGMSLILCFLCVSLLLSLRQKQNQLHKISNRLGLLPGPYTCMTWHGFKVHGSRPPPTRPPHVISLQVVFTEYTAIKGSVNAEPIHLDLYHT